MKSSLRIISAAASLLAASVTPVSAYQTGGHGHSGTQEPPDPCLQSQTQAHGSGGGAGKIRITPMMRKAGGEQEMRKAGGTQTAVANKNVHCLNPQPLPPG